MVLDYLEHNDQENTCSHHTHNERDKLKLRDKKLYPCPGEFPRPVNSFHTFHLKAAVNVTSGSFGVFDISRYH